MGRRNRLEPPMTFVAFKPVLLAMQDRDRAYLRAWVLRYVSQNGEVMTPNTAPRAPGHGALPTK
jgi:hypothetical protein